MVKSSNAPEASRGAAVQCKARRRASTAIEEARQGAPHRPAEGRFTVEVLDLLSALAGGAPGAWAVVAQAVRAARRPEATACSQCFVCRRRWEPDRGPAAHFVLRPLRGEGDGGAGLLCRACASGPGWSDRLVAELGAAFGLRREIVCPGGRA